MHPILNKQNTDKFELVIPKEFQEGKYYIYSDVTHETGFSQTLLDTVYFSNEKLVEKKKRDRYHRNGWGNSGNGRGKDQKH